MRRIRCFWHKEATASLVQRKTDWYCYGACQKAYTNEEVKAKGVNFEYEDPGSPEDIKETFSYIKSLTRRVIRGFELPCDEGGYFIPWPNDAYYKYRRFNPGEGPKYIGAKGTTPPLFWVKDGLASHLAVVEGEINALSVGQAFPEWAVCSPGSASCFKPDKLRKYLLEFQKYSTIIVIVDKDEAGDRAIDNSRMFFPGSRIPFVHYIRLKPDANELYCEKGKESLRREIEGQMRFGVQRPDFEQRQRDLLPPHREETTEGKQAVN